MVTINGKLVAAFAALVFIYACGGNTTQPGEVPPPLVSNNFEGFYIVDNGVKTDSMMFIAIIKTGAEYQLIKYTYSGILDDKLQNRGAVNAVFVNESDHRIIADGGYASVSYTPQDTAWRYVNKPEDYKLKRVCDFTAKDTSAASVDKMLDENKNAGH